MVLAHPDGQRSPGFDAIIALMKTMVDCALEALNEVGESNGISMFT